MNILITGGLGFIGSHTAVILANEDHHIVLLDNLSNSRIDVLNNLFTITKKKIIFYKGDIRDKDMVTDILKKHHIELVIHFAGLKSVSDSNLFPLEYYENNVSGTISILSAMSAARVKKIIFSSSATVYGKPLYLPYEENHPTEPMNVYGITKLQIEKILEDLTRADVDFSAVCLRYFNPIGAHESGFLGEFPNGPPNNLMPYLCQVAIGRLPYLNIYGDDYETRDGTGERDFIHVMDVAEGHVAALRWIVANSGFEVVNLGTGQPTSVYDLVRAFEDVAKCKLPLNIRERRPGDLPSYYASIDKAKSLLSWQAKKGLKEMCESSLRFSENICKEI